MNKKIMAISLLFVYFLVLGCDDTTKSDGNLLSNNQNIIYCGNISAPTVNKIEFHYSNNSNDVRDCFIKSFIKCNPANMVTTRFSIENAEHITNATILGKYKDRCAIEVNYKTTDVWVLDRNINTKCYNIADETFSAINDCEVNKSFLI
ncbi:MAG: hypothetical protein V1740_02770 [Candidatus Woesearchaeota archaeon]